MKHVYKPAPNITVTIETDELPQIPESGKISFITKERLLIVVKSLKRSDNRITAVSLIRDYCDCDLREAIQLYNEITKEM